MGRKWAWKLDMYKKVPLDLVEGSRQGSMISWLAIFVMVYLFYNETADFFTTRLRSKLSIDRQHSGNEQIAVSFNITMMDLKCDFVEVDVVSVLGNNQNATRFVRKVPLDANGVLNTIAERNTAQTDIEEISLHDTAVTKSIEELHESGEEVIRLDSKSFQYALDENNLVFVDFFASWCSHCRILAPTWEVLAKVMYDANEESEEEGGEGYGEEELRVAEGLDVPVVIAKVDCVDQAILCNEHDIRAYPTLRLFVNGKPFDGGEYQGHRTVLDMVQYLKVAEEKLGREKKLSSNSLNGALEKHLDMPLEEQHWVEAFQRMQKHYHDRSWDASEHPGCQISGTLLLNRVPGNFYIQAYSPVHDLAPHMTNCSHEIHHLSFAPTGVDRENSKGLVPRGFDQTSRPMNGNVYVTENLHEAYHHYIKLISTNGNSFQVLQSSQLASYQRDDTPEAKFLLDLSPIAVTYEMTSRKWYDYITSLMAIIGGTFTVVGFLESGIRLASRKRTKISHSKKPRSVY
mmetsp:Transcript_699/g.1667  ORF Transcript_699/g.1667 Transcript_699/m.1667 type:complete len:516 (-) Transcript_699:449-1996(-)|eukprot:CAMPEP_0172364022 /NCGR_PEP_ID=MMETSP1060-20121228/7249_1 /TAXON_ID=37318 /ORGANISM="Pseudo-nitzschia pungens, Strain cf. cingulata" /LENGTH=515 /DNA_ID=CAMNT_0013086923 /DNA_START=127 /DNA_END=1674 /DNA_ORIENTATION=+